MNTRVLVIDDEEVVRDSIREVLVPRRRDTSRIDQAASVLFDDEDDAKVEPCPCAKGIEIDLSEACSGMEGLEKTRAAIDSGRPFAVIFLDIRMPGWDGVETARRIREIDRAAEIIFVTAYSDHGIDEIVRQAGPNVGYHCKPFSPDEVRQIANKGIHDWNRIHKLERLIIAMGELSAQPAEREALMQNFLQRISEWVGTSVLLARGNRSRGYALLAGRGALGDSRRAERLLAELSGQGPREDSFRFDGVNHRGIAESDMIVVWEDDNQIDTEKIYHLRLFAKHAFGVIENARLHEQVFLGEKLSAVGRAIGTVAHDLRSPISGIQSALAMVKMSLNDPAQAGELIELIGQSAEDAMALVSEILDFTKQSSIERQPLEVEDLFTSVRRQTRQVLATQRVRLTTECEPGISVFGDAKKLARVLTNLVANAAEALGAHGGSSASISVSARSSEGKVLIEVADCGPGIPRQIRTTLFEPFVTQGKSSGTGLGLAIARQIVEAHGGELSFTSSDRGTTFTLSLARPEIPSIPTPAGLANNSECQPECGVACFK